MSERASPAISPGQADARFEYATSMGAPAQGVTPLQVASRRKGAILVFAIIVTLIVGLFVHQMPVRYAASASVMIDLRQPRVSSGESLLPSQPVDIELLRTYMEALRSPRLVDDVVRQLALTTEPEFCAPPRSWAQTLTAPLSHLHRPRASASCQISAADAARKLAPAVGFANDGRSYVIAIDATAGNPMLAARIANAYAGAFISRRRQEQAALADQADSWLTAHLAQLRGEVLAADHAVTELRQGGKLTSLRGQTLLEQSLSEMNSQLVIASSDLAQKQSTLRELQEGPQSGRGGLDTSAAVLTSPIIQALIEREGLLASAQAELSTRLGSANTELLANQAELSRVRQQIHTQLGKAAIGLQGEVDALAARRSALQDAVQALQKQLGAQGIADTRLQDLERDATSARSRYDEAALRLEQIHLDSAMQRADVQLLVEASPPDFPSFPRTRMIVTGTFLAMLGVGAGLAYALELLSRVFTTAEQVEDQTGLHVLGLYPKGAPAAGGGRAQDPRADEALQAVFGSLMHDTHGAHGQHGGARSGRVLMVTSAVPGEGKTSFCVALGRAAATRGLSVAVLDGDLRCSTMRSHFRQLEQRPVDETEAAMFAEHAVDQASGLNILLPRLPASNPHSILASPRFPQTLRDLRAKHDVIIIDTPPVLAVPDVLSIGRLADEVVLLVAWRDTRRPSVNAALQALRRAHAQVSGIVLSKVDLRRFARAHSGGSYYAKLYPAYQALGRG